MFCSLDYLFKIITQFILYTDFLIKIYNIFIENENFVKSPKIVYKFFISNLSCPWKIQSMDSCYFSSFSDDYCEWKWKILSFGVFDFCLDEYFLGLVTEKFLKLRSFQPQALLVKNYQKNYFFSIKSAIIENLIASIVPLSTWPFIHACTYNINVILLIKN